MSDDEDENVGGIEGVELRAVTGTSDVNAAAELAISVAPFGLAGVVAEGMTEICELAVEDASNCELIEENEGIDEAEKIAELKPEASRSVDEELIRASEEDAVTVPERVEDKAIPPVLITVGAVDDVLTALELPELPVGRTEVLSVALVVEATPDEVQGICCPSRFRHTLTVASPPKPRSAEAPTPLEAAKAAVTLRAAVEVAELGSSDDSADALVATDKVDDEIDGTTCASDVAA